MNTKIPIHNRNLKIRKKSIKDWKIAEEDKKDIIKFLDDASIGLVNKGKKIEEARLVKYLDLLKISLEYFNKPSSKLTLKDMKQFEKDLTSNKISKRKKKPYAISVKVDIKLGLRNYLKWKLKEDAIPLTSWFDLKVPNKTPDYLKEEEIDKLYKACKNNEERFVIAVLFDSGARAEEFHNIRYEDIELPKENSNFVKITIKEEYSKTQGRTISLYWKHSLEAVRDYLRDREKDGIKSKDAVAERSYDAIRQVLARLGKRILNKSIHYHLFRHSSATYYASQLNRQQLCYRYGWKFSSDMPDRYISRAGMNNKEIDEKFESTKLEDMKRENDKLKLKIEQSEEKSNEMKEMLTDFKEEFIDFKELINIYATELGKYSPRNLKIKIPERLLKKREGKPSL